MSTSTVRAPLNALEHALLHDHQEAYSGRVEKMTQYGCELRLASEGEHWSPVFQRGKSVFLQLLDEKAQATQTLAVRVDGVSRSAADWIYRLSFVSEP
jgi:hypothetical protein